jgi:hypothetical protein
MEGWAHTRIINNVVIEAVISPVVVAPVAELLVSRTGITQTPVLFENFKKLKNYRIRVGVVDMIWDSKDPETQWPSALIGWS